MLVPSNITRKISFLFGYFIYWVLKALLYYISTTYTEIFISAAHNDLHSAAAAAAASIDILIKTTNNRKEQRAAV